MEKKVFEKVIITIIIFCILVSSIPENAISVVALASGKEQINESINIEDVSFENIVQDECTVDKTVYDLGGNKKMEEVYFNNIRFEDENGELVDYDPSLELIETELSIGGESLEGYTYENKDGDAKHYIPEAISEDTPILMEKGAYSISFYPVQDTEYIDEEKQLQDMEEESNSEEDGTQIEWAKPVLEEEIETTEDNFSDVVIEDVATEDIYGEECIRPLKAIYKNPVGRYSLEYTSNDAGIKENIVLDTVPENNEFVYEFKLKGLDIRKNPLDEGFTFYDIETGEIVGEIDAPFMNDASGEAYSEEVECELQEKEDHIYRLIIRPELSYLENECRMYPVTIDPTISWTGTNKISDVYTCNGSAYRDTNFYSSGVKCLSVGKSGSQGVYRSYLRFSDVNTAVKGKYVESATLKIYETGQCVKGETVQAHPINSDWNPSTITWSNSPSCNTSSFYDSFVTSGEEGKLKELDLTKNLRQIARNEISGFGIMLRAKEEGATGKYTQFYNSRYGTASMRPKLTVVYYDAPTKATSVTTDLTYYKKGASIKVSWAGITSKALKRVEYRLVGHNDATNKNTDTIIAYSAETKLGDSSSGTATISDSKNWGDGCYSIGVRGVDKSDITGDGRYKTIHIDSTPPMLGAVSVSPSGITKSQTPVLTWSGASDLHFDKVQYQVDDNEYVDAGTSTAGSITIPDYFFPYTGTYNIRVRAVDKAGNTSDALLIKYYLDKTAPTGKLSMSPPAGIWTESSNPLISFSNLVDEGVGVDITQIQYCIVQEGKGETAYKNAQELTYTTGTGGDNGSFRMDIQDQGKEDGSYTIYVKFKDKLGNSSTGSLSYKKDKNPPTGTITCSRSEDNLHDTVQITAAMSDGQGSGIKSSSLNLLDLSGNKVAMIYDNFTTSSVTRPFNTKEIKNGNYQLVLTIFDNMNHKNTITLPVSIKNQLDEPELTGSVRNDGKATIEWTQEVKKNPLKEMQYQIPGSNTWSTIPESNQEKGSYTFLLPAQENEYAIKVRGVDDSGIAGKEGTVLCVYDKTKPKSVISSMKQGILTGTVSDEYLSSWRIEIKEKEQEEASYEIIAEGKKEIQDGVLTIINVEDERYQVGQTYEIRLTAQDKAGNTNSTIYEYTKKDGDISATSIQPTYRIQWPKYPQESTEKYRIPSNSNYFELSAETQKAPQKVEWYIDNQKTIESSDNGSQGSVLEFYKIKNNYMDGNKHSVVAKCTDSEGDITYSAPVMEKMLVENLISKDFEGQEVEIYDGAIELMLGAFEGYYEKTVSFENLLLGFQLDVEEYCKEPNTITYEVSIDGSLWKPVQAGINYKINDLFPDQIAVDTLRIKAKFYRDGRSYPSLSVFSITGDVITPDYFLLSEMDNYVPEFLSAISKINYKTYLTWNRPKEKSQADYSKESFVELPDNVTYEIYRETDKSALKKQKTPVVEGITDDYYSEMNVNYGKAFYYRIRAVRTTENSDGTIKKEYSSFSNIISTKVVDGDEYNKFLGNKEYWEYEPFSTPNGSGVVEKCRGNFNYEQTDVVIPNNKMPVEFGRSYNSQASSTSSLGWGWNHSFDIELLNVNETNRLVDRKALKDDSGTIFLFERIGDGTYASSMGKYITLREEKKSEEITIPARNGNNKVSEKLESSYVMTTKDNQEYWFNSGGQLIYEREPNGSFILFSYDNRTGRLLSATTNQNLVLRFQYVDSARDTADDIIKQAIENGNNDPDQDSRGDGNASSNSQGNVTDMEEISCSRVPRGDGGEEDMTVGEAVINLGLVRSVILPDGGNVEFQYDDTNHLTNVIRKDGNEGKNQVTYKYAYDQDGNLTKLYDALEQEYSITYVDDRVAEVCYPSVNNHQESIRFTYNDIQEEDMVYKTLIQKGLDSKYCAGEIVKGNNNGNVLYTKDTEGVECTYTYQDNMLKSTSMKSEYQIIENGAIVSKEGIRNSSTTYDENVNMNPIVDVDENKNTVRYEYGNQQNEWLDDLPTGATEEVEGEIVADYEYEYDEYGNEIWESDAVTNDSVQTTYYGEESEFAGEVKETVEKKATYLEDGTIQYIVNTTSYIYEYDETTGDRTEQITDIANNKSITSIFKYNKMGNLVYYSDGTGNIETHEYDFLGREIKGSYSEGGITSTTEYTYDDNGALLRKKEKDGSILEYTYDARGQVTDKVESRGKMNRSYSTAYDYEWESDKDGNQILNYIVTETKPGGQISSECRNPSGWVLWTKEDGMITQNEYNKHGECILSRVDSVDGEAEDCVTLFLYDNSGNKYSEIQNPSYEDGSWKIDEESIVTSSTFDSYGNTLSSTDGMNQTVQYEYDKTSRLSKVILPDGTKEGNVTQYVYDIYEENEEEDEDISCVKTIDANGNVSKTFSNSEDKVVRVVDEGNGQVSPIYTDYEYDQKGNLIQETFANGNYKKYEYDGRNRLVKVIYYQNNSAKLCTKYTYSTSDQILSMEDLTIEGGTERRYHYTVYQYDDMDQLIQYSEYVDGDSAPSNEIVFTYDDAGRRTSVSYGVPQNHIKSLRYEYDPYGRLLAIYGENEGKESGLIRSYTYTAEGNVGEIKTFRGVIMNGTGNYISAQYEYDSIGRVISIQYTDSADPENILEKYEYSYDKNSDIISERIEQNFIGDAQKYVNEVRTHTYDALGRLISTETVNQEDHSRNLVTYTYDRVGNRISCIDGENEKQYVYNSLNQLTSMSEQKGASLLSEKRYSYDLSGNLLKEIDQVDKDSIEYAYDGDNRLETAIVKVGDEVKLTQNNKYNGNGERVQKQENQKTTNYFYQSGAVVFTTDEENTVTTFNLLGEENQAIATGRQEDELYYYIKDIRGSSTSIYSETGQTVEAYRYGDFGETEPLMDSGFSNEICYAGGIYDDSTGLYYLNARYYDPTQGRFTAQDTYRGEQTDADSWNLYAYCANNPIGSIDPSGHFIETALDLASIGWSIYDLATKPSWQAVGSLVWDVGAAFIPFVPGSYTAKGLSKVKKASVAARKTKLTRKTIKSAKLSTKFTLKVASKASDLGKGSTLLTVGQYYQLKKFIRVGHTVEVHHIIEKHLDWLTLPKSRYPSIPITKELHYIISGRWRRTVTYYRKKYKTNKFDKDTMKMICKKVYADMPGLRDIAYDIIDDYGRQL